MLNYKVENLDGIDDNLRDLYVKSGTGYTLQVDGVSSADKEKITEFRTNNIRLLKQVSELEKKFDGVDLTKYNDMLKNLQEADDAKLSETEKITRNFENRETAIKQSLSDAETKNKEISLQLETLMIDGEIQKSISKVGHIKQGALQDILRRGREVWSVEDGKTIPKNTDGTTKIDKEGKIISFDVWAESLVKDASFLFGENTGGNANGGNGGSVKTIALGDDKSFIMNVDKIASGEVKVM